MHVLGWAAVVAVVTLIAVNAAFMLFSPKAWFRLPSWILSKGSLTEKRYATGLGAVQVRIAGAFVLGMIAWVLYNAFSR